MARQAALWTSAAGEATVTAVPGRRRLRGGEKTGVNVERRLRRAPARGAAATAAEIRRAHLLATHHARYALLLRAFLAWQQRARAQRERRQRIQLACRVGAAFSQRRFWTRWRALVTHQREQRRLVHEENPAGTRRAAVTDAASIQKEPDESQQPAPERTKTDKSVDLVEDVDATSTASPTTTTNDLQCQPQGSSVLVRKKLYLKRWKFALDSKVNHTADTTPDPSDPHVKITRFRSLHALRRWREALQRTKKHAILEQRACFFLYYWLAKRSLDRLGRHARIQRRNRQLAVVVERATAQRRLVKAMRLWRVRFGLLQALEGWWSYMRRRRHQRLLYGPMTTSVLLLSRRRLLRRALSVWGRQHVRKQAQLALERVLDRQFHLKMARVAWRMWRSLAHQLAQLDARQRGRQERRIRRVWDAWSSHTQEKERRELQRRRAVRHRYLAMLGKGFTAFRAWQTQRRRSLSRASAMADAADRKLLSCVLSTWDHFTSARKLRRLKQDQAEQHARSQLVKRVWVNGLKQFFRIAREREEKLRTARQQQQLCTLHRCITAWQGICQAERDRERALDATLAAHTARRARATRVRVLELWAEVTRAKAAQRIVNAEIRGHAQRRTLQRNFTRWVTCVSLLRWQQITRERAEQHHQAVLTRKCLLRWRRTVARRRRYRDKTRAALLHWKLTMERKAFAGWTRYLRAKKDKQQRIHAALDFRHGQFMRDGLCRWTTAALYLQEQREQRVTRSQASHAAKIWRRVAAIARHWRFIAIRSREEGQKHWKRRHHRLERPLQVQYSVPRLVEQRDDGRQQRLLPAVPLARSEDTATQPEARHLRDPDGPADWTAERAPLSEFVLLPRKRPQPRRPVELMLLAQSEAENRQPRDWNVTTHTHEALRCGFQFPVELQESIASPPSVQTHQTVSRGLPRDSEATRLAPVTCNSHDENAKVRLPESTGTQLDALERQLRAMGQRKQELKAFQLQLESLRRHVRADPQLQPKLHAMEQEHAARARRWLQTKERIQSLAREIQLLRSALHG